MSLYGWESSELSDHLGNKKQDMYYFHPQNWVGGGEHHSSPIFASTPHRLPDKDRGWTPYLKVGRLPLLFKNMYHLWKKTIYGRPKENHPPNSLSPCLLIALSPLLPPPPWHSTCTSLRLWFSLTHPPWTALEGNQDDCYCVAQNLLTISFNTSLTDTTRY